MTQKREEVIRGKRASIDHWMFDWDALGIDDKTLDEILDSFVANDKIEKTDGGLLYCSSSNKS